MSVTPAIRLIAHLDRAGAFVFVAIPDERGRYLRTDRSVVLVACPLCHAIKGEPCKSRAGYTGGTHGRRRLSAKSLPGRQNDLIEPVDLLAPEPSVPDLPKLDTTELPPIDIQIRRKILGSVTLCEPRAIA